MAFVQSAATLFGGATTAGVTLTVTANNILIVGIFCSDAPTTINTPTGGGYTYTQIDSVSPSANIVAKTYWVKPTVSGSLTVTETTTGSVFGYIVVTELSGRDGTTPVSAHTGQNQSSVAAGTDTITSGALTAATGDDVWVGTINDAFGSVNVTAGTGFTGESGTNEPPDDNGLNGLTEHKLNVSSGSTAGTFSTTSAAHEWITLAVAIKATAGNSSSVSPSVSPSASISPSSSVSASSSRSPSPSSSVSSSASPSGGTVYIERTVIDYID